MNRSVILTPLMASQVFAYVQAHQTAYTKYVYFLVYLYFNKAI